MELPEYVKPRAFPYRVEPRFAGKLTSSQVNQSLGT
ncbi:hypothetical protein E2C01_071414 [Portunus trituberculatus]|uniref:Uncharacterized protein n=1 Tax=Portunus trituberculatus TaxID=210409 RepID=A0A5B7I662_PORTR|nr:hypothetical protein [Portunus trituberculatus]